jgi:hypothetical protein
MLSRSLFSARKGVAIAGSNFFEEWCDIKHHRYTCFTVKRVRCQCFAMHCHLVHVKVAGVGLTKATPEE